MVGILFYWIKVTIRRRRRINPPEIWTYCTVVRTCTPSQIRLEIRQAKGKGGKDCPKVSTLPSLSHLSRPEKEKGRERERHLFGIRR